MICSYGLIPPTYGMRMKVVYLIECDHNYVPTGDLYAEITKYDRPIDDPIVSNQNQPPSDLKDTHITYTFCTKLLTLGKNIYSSPQEWSLDLCELVGFDPDRKVNHSPNQHLMFM